MNIPPLAAATATATTKTSEAASIPTSEADIVLPDLGRIDFLGLPGDVLLGLGLIVCVGGLIFGLAIYRRLKNLPVHKSMRDVSELIYATCKTYLVRQIVFVMILELFIGAIIIFYFGYMREFSAERVAIIVAMSLVGIFGSVGVAWFGIRVNTFANSRSAFASLRGQPYPTYAIPMEAGMSIGTMLVCIELIIMLIILLFIPGEYAGPCFIGFAIGESLGAAALRIAGGIFTKIADIAADLMKISFNIKEDDARNPGVIADCTGDNAGDSVGPTADGFETYGVTGVALILFIMLAVNAEIPGPEKFQEVQIKLLVWIFAMRIMMVAASVGSYWLNERWARSRFGEAQKMNFETPLSSLVWVTSLVSIAGTFIVSWLMIPELGGDPNMWWHLSAIISCGTLAGAIIPEVVKIFTSTHSHHVNEVVTASKQGGASLNILSGLTAGNFSAFWMGIVIVALMGVAYGVSTLGMQTLMFAAPVFAFGLVAFGFLGMGPVTIAVDSYGPVTDNAQSIFELSTIETAPGIEDELEHEFGFRPDFERAKEHLEENDGAGNTFKATAKPVLIGTAVVGATTLIFSIIQVLRANVISDAMAAGLTEAQGVARFYEYLSLLHAPFLLGLVLGGAMIYWFTGASMQAVTTGAYKATEFIKANIKLEGIERASTSDSRKVVGICTKYAQHGMINIFFVIFFATLAFACVDPFFFIGYLISLAIFGLYQAIFMANAGGAWDNAKKIVETALKEKGTDLHEASIVGDTVGDPFKDTSSVAMNPVIKFTTLFGVLAVELALEMSHEENGAFLAHTLAVIFFLIAVYFVWRSFYRMRIQTNSEDTDSQPATPEPAATA